MSIESVTPFNHLILSSPSPAFNLSQHQGISNESALCIRWPKYWSFIISPSNEYSGLISFRIDSFDLCAVKGTLKSLFQHHTSKHQFNLLYGPTLTSVLTTGINIPFTIQTCIGKVMSLLFNMLSRLVLVVKNLPATAGDIRDVDSIPGSGRSPGEGHENPLQYSCLENAMDRGAWKATVHRVTKNWTWLSD